MYETNTLNQEILKWETDRVNHVCYCMETAIINNWFVTIYSTTGVILVTIIRLRKGATGSAK